MGVCVIEMSLKQSPGGGSEETGVCAERLPVHEAVLPERAGAEAAKQNPRFQRPLSYAVNCAGYLRIVESAGFPVG